MSGRTQRRARDQRDAKSNRGKQAARDRFKMPWKGENGRWTEFARTQFALVLAAALTPNERLHIASGGDYPSDRKRMEAVRLEAYGSVWKRFACVCHGLL